MYIWDSQRRSVSGYCLPHYIDTVYSLLLVTTVTASLGFPFTGTMFVISSTRQRCQFNGLHSIKVVKWQENKCERFFNHNIKMVFLFIFSYLRRVSKRFLSLPWVEFFPSIVWQTCAKCVFERENIMSTSHPPHKDGWRKNLGIKFVHVHVSEFISTNRLYLISLSRKLKVRSANINGCDHCISRDREREW